MKPQNAWMNRWFKLYSEYFAIEMNEWNDKGCKRTKETALADMCTLKSFIKKCQVSMQTMDMYFSGSNEIAVEFLGCIFVS